MRILWIGLAMVLPVVAQTPPDGVSRALQDLAKLTVAVQFQGGVVKNAPYSADGVTQTTQVLGDGNRIEQSTTQKLYRDSEGRERREETVLATGALAQTTMPHVVTILDPVENVLYTLDTEQHTARRSNGAGFVRVFTPPGTIGKPSQFYYVADGNVYTAADAAGVGKEDLGSKTIEGVAAQGTRTTETIPAGQIGNVLPINIVDEAWYSPELKMNVLTTHSDPRTGETVYKLMNINRAEQPKSLFEPPADYTVTGPAGRK